LRVDGVLGRLGEGFSDVDLRAFADASARTL
jgi:hypothetical protein